MADEPVDETPDEEQRQYEARLQRRLQILKQELEAGKCRFAPGLGVIESLQQVRYAPDGSVDLDTVDGRVRSLALAVEAMHDRDELRDSITLAEIQTIYFGFLETNFGPYYEVMRKRGMSPHDAGMAASSSPATVEELTKDVEKFLDAVSDFWSQTYDVAQIHLEDMDCLKGVFGGDLFPSCDENIASKCGVYVDTLILPDPFLRSRHIFTQGPPRQQAYYLIKHGLNLLQYKELACADVTPPVVAVLPDLPALDESEQQFVQRLAKEDGLIHAERVFGRRFESVEELLEFAQTLDTIDQLRSSVADPQRVLFDADVNRDIQAQFDDFIGSDAFELIGDANPGVLVALNGIGRMGTSNELLIKSGRLRATPLIDAPTSWEYFVWKLEYDAASAERAGNLTDLHVVHALERLAHTDMEWLGRVPPDALIELRRTGAIHEIRETLAAGVRELASANPDGFHRTSDLVFENIEAAFEAHRDSIKQLREKKWKFAGSDMGSWLVVGSLAVAAAATGMPVWGLAAVAADQLLPAPKLKDIPKSVRDLAAESQQLKQSPVGMLFKYGS